jgi:hypothetical protein
MGGNTMPTPNTKPDLNKLTEEELRALVIRLYEQISALEREVEALKASLNKNSKNSSQPPSKDGYKRIPNSREKTGKRPGGVAGHEGHRIQMPEDYQNLIDKGQAIYKLEDHTNGNEEYVSKWVIDIQVTPVFIEHRFKPGEVPEKYSNDVTYGEEVKALSVDLTEDGMVSAERVADFLDSATDGVVHPTKAALLGFHSELAEALAPEIAAIKEDVRRSPRINVDESPMKSTQTVIREKGKDDVIKNAQGTTFNVCTRAYCTPESTLYTVNPKKDIEGVERDGVITDYDGDLIHDHDIKLYRYGGRHGECNAHPSRELKGLAQNGISWADEARELFKDMNTHKNDDLAQGIEACDPAILEQFEERFNGLLAEGYKVCNELDPESYGYKKLRPLVARLDGYGDEHFLFMYDYAVPFTNNEAERALRAEKTKEKVSGCYRSWQAIADFMDIRGFISTVRKRGLNVIHSLRAIFKGESVLAPIQ